MNYFNHETMFNSIPEGLWAVDQNYTIILFNETAAHITGWSPHNVIGKKCFEIFQGSHCKLNCPLKAAMTQMRTCYASHVLIMTKKDKSIPVMISATPLKNKDNTIIGAMGLFTDQRSVYPTYLGRFTELGLIGASSPMREVFQLIEIVAETDSNVLIFGKTGTGKELAAQAIHKLSYRKNNPFVKVNCAALSDGLLESELFGHERGAFTGALTKRIGRFEFANKGTIFLDEIAEISPRFQAKLLRVIQEGEFERVGSSSTQKVDVRIIVATNKNLQNLVKQNLFRDDLFYRLNVFPLYLPELKERKSDLSLLIDHFLNLFNIRFKKQKRALSQDALMVLYDYNYPGNVRELRNILEHAFIKSPGNIIGKEHLPDYLVNKKKYTSLSNIIQKKEIDHIKDVIDFCDGNKSKAAKILGISRKTLYNKLNNAEDF